MGISKDQLIGATELIKAYTDDELNDSETRLRTLIQSLYNVIVNDEDNVVNALDETHGLQDTPIGVLLPFMGITVPKHYLLCDGTEYNISDYPILANHFLTDFNKVNYFGGDGATTFKVPDLRGEFLRGSGTATRNTGTGLAVGLHQEATLFPNIWAYVNDKDNAKTITVEYEKDESMKATQTDNTVNSKSFIDIIVSTKSFNNRDGGTAKFAARPTNTAVNYIIKAEPTYFIKCDPRKYIYSEDEIRVGTDVDGSPVYQKVFSNITVDRPDIAASGNNTLIDLPDELNISKVLNLNIVMIQSRDGTLINNSFNFEDGDNSFSCSTSINLRDGGRSTLVFTFGRGCYEPTNAWAYGWFPLKATVYLTYTKN